jgi:hypothetical protein
MSSIVENGERKKRQGKVHKYIKNMFDEYECEYCDKTSKNQSTISEHITRIHPMEAGRKVLSFKCHFCEKRFNNASGRDQHINNNHETTRKICAYTDCSHSSKTNECLMKHYVKKHLCLDILTQKVDGDNTMCLHCNSVMKNQNIAYHVGGCNPKSPYCKVKNINTSTTTSSITTVITEDSKPYEQLCSPCVKTCVKPDIPNKLENVNFTSAPSLNKRFVIIAVAIDASEKSSKIENNVIVSSKPERKPNLNIQDCPPPCPIIRRRK